MAQTVGDAIVDLERNGTIEALGVSAHRRHCGSVPDRAARTIAMPIMTVTEYAEELASLNHGLATGDLDWTEHMDRIARIRRPFVAEHGADS